MARSLAVRCIVSHSQGSQFLATLNGLQLSLDQVKLYVGMTSPGPPATFADLTSPTSWLVIYEPLISVSIKEGSWVVQFSDQMGGGSWALGDPLWFAVFDSATPGPTDVPLAVAGPFVIGP